MTTSKIVITRREHGFHACIEGHPEMWEASGCYVTAIEKLIVSYPEELRGFYE